MLPVTTKVRSFIFFIFQANSSYKASRGAAAQSVTFKPTGCGFDPHSRRLNIYLNLYFHFLALVSRRSAALSSATQHAMPPGPSAYPAVCSKSSSMYSKKIL